MENAPVVKESELMTYEDKPLSVSDVMHQITLIQQVMREAMKSGEHYGTIPGCGPKPALLKPGAEKLNLTFRMAPDPIIDVVDLGRGHREYRVKCYLRSILTGKLLGVGVGSASTMESKWRYRTGPAESTGKSVPKEYWDLRKSDPQKAQDLLGGKGFSPKKSDNGVWEIVRQGEKVEHDNPADYYNTCIKMAKKRALVDAVLTVTAASDIFTQDIEEMVENEVVPGASHPPKPQPESQPEAETTKNFEWLTRMKGAKGKLGNKDYYRILRNHGFDHSNLVLDPKTQDVILNEMIMLFNVKQKEMFEGEKA